MVLPHPEGSSAQWRASRRSHSLCFLQDTSVTWVKLEVRALSTVFGVPKAVALTWTKSHFLRLNTNNCLLVLSLFPQKSGVTSACCQGSGPRVWFPVHRALLACREQCRHAGGEGTMTLQGTFETPTKLSSWALSPRWFWVGVSFKMANTLA